MTALSTGRIWNALSCVNSGIFGANTHYQAQVGSTNDIARRLAKAHAPTGTLVITDEQTAGRGRHDHVWVAPPETSLLMSVIFHPEMLPSHVNRLVMACGVSIARACQQMTGVKVNVKWPNDLLLNGKKFTGILPESAIVGDQLEWMIVGMGINVNQVFDKNDPLYETATSLRMITGQEIDRPALLAAILHHLNEWYGKVDSDALLDEWRQRSVLLGMHVSVQTGSMILEGTAHDLDETGALLLKDHTGEFQLLSAGETTILK